MGTGSNTIGRNIAALIDSRNTTQTAVAAVAGATGGAVSLWISGRSKPRSKYLERIADYYGVTMDELVSDSNGLYAKSYGLSDAPGGAVHVTSKPARMVPIRTLGYVHAGEPDEPWEEEGEAMLYEDLALNHPGCFALKVNGDCMNRNFTDRDYIFVDPDMKPHDGSIGVVSIDGETVVRRVRQGNSTLMLIAESTNAEAYDDIIVRDGDVRLVGTVFWCQSMREMD